MTLLRALAETVFPWRCASCGARSAGPVCDACARRLEPLGPACARCGRPLPDPTPACAGCRAAPPPYRRARAAFRYAGPARDALIAFKLAGERRAASWLGEAMAGAARGALAGEVICFVPATRVALRERGWNPAEALAGAVGRRLGLPLSPALEKVRPTRDQAGLARAQRRRNLAGAFRARPVAGPVLLVDDVMTTGATAWECAAALRAAGAAAVDVLTFARAV